MPKKAKEKTEAKKPRMAVYAITRSRGNSGGKDFFTPCGSGFRNEDGSLTLVLSHLPIGGEMHVRAPKDEPACWKAIPRAKYRVFELPDGNNSKWWEIGVAFGNEKDESLNVILKVLPNNYRLNVRLPKEAE